MPLPPPITPTGINPVGTDYNILHPNNSPGGLGGKSCAVAQPNGLWIGLDNIDSENSYDMFQSTDHGVTWTAVDTAHAPRMGSQTGGALFWRGTVATVACLDDSNFIQLCDFDSAAGAWGTPYADSTQPTSHFMQLFRQESGNIVVFFEDDSTTQLAVMSWNGASWSAMEFVSANIPATHKKMISAGIVMDVLNRFSIIAPLINSVSNVPDGFFYQLLLDDLTFGPFIFLPNAAIASGAWFWNNPIIGNDGDSLLVGVYDGSQNPCVMTCVAPLTQADNSAHWSIGPAIDHNGSGFCPRLLLVDDLLVAVYIQFLFPDFPRLGFQQADGSWIWESLSADPGASFINIVDIGLTGATTNQMSIIYGVDFGPPILGAIFSPLPGNGLTKIVDVRSLTSVALPVPNELCKACK